MRSTSSIAPIMAPLRSLPIIDVLFKRIGLDIVGAHPKTRTSVYHPQTNGLIEHFNKTLKQMLRKAIVDDGAPELHGVRPLQAAVWEETPGPPGSGQGGMGAAAILTLDPHRAHDPNGNVIYLYFFQIFPLFLQIW